MKHLLTQNTYMKQSKETYRNIKQIKSLTNVTQNWETNYRNTLLQNKTSLCPIKQSATPNKVHVPLM